MKGMIKSGPLRRILWSMLLTGMVVLMVFQVQTQFMLFISNPVVSNIDIQFPQTLEFPSVAICNTNQFRITFVSEYHLYDLMQILYGSGGMGRLQTGVESFSDELMAVPHANDSKQFLIDAGHKLEHMLMNCWMPNGDRCNASHFEPYITDYGVCYAFNTDLENPIMVDGGGWENGLYMMLNVESYERTPGPNPSIGLKLLIYDQRSAPSINQNAVDVGPGNLASISCQRIESNRIPKSEGGTCLDKAEFVHFHDHPYSIDICKIDKIISQIIDVCGCYPYHAPEYDQMVKDGNSDNLPPICTVEQHFSCVIFHKQMSMRQSRCDEGCKSVKFRPSMSFAKLPKDVIVAHYYNMTATSLRYYAAIEAAQRLDPEAVRLTEAAIVHMYELRDWLRDNRVEPIYAKFENSFQRLLKVECFKNISIGSDYMFSKLQSASVGDNVYLSFLHILHPEISIKELTSSSDTYVWKYKDEITEAKVEIQNIVHDLKTFIGYFHVETYAVEMSMDIAEYEIVYDMLEQYDQHNITKMELAQNIGVLDNLFAGITSSIIDPMNKNIVSNLAFQTHNYNYSVTVSNMLETIKDDKYSNMLSHVLFPNSKRKDDCVREVKSELESVNTQYDNSVFISSICPLQDDHGNLGAKLSAAEKCFFGDLKNASENIAILVKEMKPSILDAFNELQTLMENFLFMTGAGGGTQEDNFVSINVFYTDLSVERQIQKRSYSFWSFLCDIGGTLGLCLGASIVTVYELVDFFLLKPLCRHLQAIHQTVTKPTANGIHN